MSFHKKVLSLRNIVQSGIHSPLGNMTTEEADELYSGLSQLGLLNIIYGIQDSGKMKIPKFS